MYRFKYAQLTLLGVVVAALSCKPSSNKDAFEGHDDAGTPTEVIEYNNPPAENFNVEGSSPIAVLIADQVMNAMGGRAKWDATNVISWNFFGKRTLLWDKENNRVRVDIPEETLVISLDITDMEGKAWKAGDEVTAEDELKKYLKKAHQIWVNDSYWLVMPFKLKDDGVTLTYDREDTTVAGAKADVLRLSFKDVGYTPANAYEVWVNVDTKLIDQWAFYKDARDESPKFIRPWGGYQDYDGLLLSGERGKTDITDIVVMKKVPKRAFDSPDPVKY